MEGKENPHHFHYDEKDKEIIGVENVFPSFQHLS